MEFKAEIASYTIATKFTKIYIKVEKDNAKELHKVIANFIDKPLKIDMLVDDGKYAKELKQITDEQRKRIYATLKDISDHLGYNREEAKDLMKNGYTKLHEIKTFSLSDCSSELAFSFTEYLVEIAFRNDVPFSQNPAKAFADIKKYYAMCLKYKKCVECGKHADIHHLDAIGMGNNRKTYDDSNSRKIALCREHHSEAHTGGLLKFQQKYHLEIE